MAAAIGPLIGPGIFLAFLILTLILTMGYGVVLEIP
jgi:hypothetical protein